MTIENCSVSDEMLHFDVIISHKNIRQFGRKPMAVNERFTKKGAGEKRVFGKAGTIIISTQWPSVNLLTDRKGGLH